MQLCVEVLGPVRVLRDGHEVGIGGPRQHELLGRLTAAANRPVTSARLTRDLWDEPPPRAGGALATAVAELRRRLEPERPPRTRSRLLVTTAGGYGLHWPEGAVDAGRLEAAAAHAADDPGLTVDRLRALARRWPGEPYADLPDRDWVRAERRRLAELHAQVTERYAAAALVLGHAAEVVPLLGAHTTAHPGREQGWAALARALHREERTSEALDVLRRARRLLADDHGLDPGPALTSAERDVLGGARHAGPAPAGELTGAGRHGERARLRSAVDLARSAAVSGGRHLASAQRQRVDAALAADRTGDPVLTARVIGGYDVPTVWTRSDDPVGSAELVDLARRTLDRFPATGPAGPALRARLLAVVAVEHRGSRDAWALRAAHEAEEIARDLGDPAVLAMALDGRFVQSFQVPGASAERALVGTELVALARRHDLPVVGVLGHLVRMQADAARGEVGSADDHARAAERWAADAGLPVAELITAWYRAMRTAQTASAGEAARAYRDADRRLAAVDIPGLRDGLLPLALLSVRIRHGGSVLVPHDTDPRSWGPYWPWVAPLAELDRGDRDAAVHLVVRVPDPAPDHLREVLWALVAEVGLRTRSAEVTGRAAAALAPAAHEDAGAGSGVISLGPVRGWLDRLAAVQPAVPRQGR